MTRAREYQKPLIGARSEQSPNQPGLGGWLDAPLLRLPCLRRKPAAFLTAVMPVFDLSVRVYLRSDFLLAAT